jgi:hypothetical protein
LDPQLSLPYELHVWDCPGEQAPWPPQDSHWQLLPQVWEPQSPQPSVELGTQTPCPLHAPALQVQLLVQVFTWVPQLPQESVSVPPGEHTPCPLHVPQVQELVQVCDPQSPHPWLLFGAHTPCPVHDPDDHWHDSEQVSVSVPQLPQPSVRCEAGAQAPCPTQLPNSQSHPALQVSVSVPQLPHPSWRFWPGEHCGSLTQVLASHPPSARQVSPGSQDPLAPTQKPPHPSVAPQGAPASPAVQLGTQHSPATQIAAESVHTVLQLPQVQLLEHVSTLHEPQPVLWPG